jgi:hypothetical protein
MAVTVHQASSSGSSRVPQPAVSSDSFIPGPSHTHSVDQNLIISDSLQATEEEPEETVQKWKGKAVDITELKADVQVKKVVAGGKQKARRGRSKKNAD